MALPDPSSLQQVILTHDVDERLLLLGCSSTHLKRPGQLGEYGGPVVTDFIRPMDVPAHETTAVPATAI